MVVILFKVYLHSGALVIKSDVLLNAVSVLVTPVAQDTGQGGQGGRGNRNQPKQGRLEMITHLGEQNTKWGGLIPNKTATSETRHSKPPSGDSGVVTAGLPSPIKNRKTAFRVWMGRCGILAEKSVGQWGRIISHFFSWTS